MSKPPLPRVRLPIPHPGQRHVRQTMRRINFLAAGRRWQKTTLAVAWAVERLVTRKEEWIWAADVLRQSRVAFEEMRRAVAGYARFNESQLIVSFPGAGKISFVSTEEVDNLRTMSADQVIMDEASLIDPAAYYEVFRPMLISTQGGFLAMFTPKGITWNWFELEKTMSGRSGDGDDAMAWQIPTLGCKIVDRKLVRVPHPHENPRIPWREIVNLFETLGVARFKQEILCQPAVVHGAVFPMFDRDVHVRSLKLVDGVPVNLGIDYGYRTLVAVAFQIFQDGTDMPSIHVLKVWRFRYEIQYEALRMIRNDSVQGRAVTEIVKVVGCDPGSLGSGKESAMPVIDLTAELFPFARVDYSTYPPDRDVELGCERLRGLLCSADGKAHFFINDRECDTLISAMSNYAYSEHKPGMPEKPEPKKDGVNDHPIDAVRYGLNVTLNRKAFVMEEWA